MGCDAGHTSILVLLCSHYFSLAFNSFRPSGFPCWRLWCPHRNCLAPHSTDMLNVSILTFCGPRSVCCLSSSTDWIDEKQSCYSLPALPALAVDLACSARLSEVIWGGCSFWVLVFSPGWNPGTLPQPPLLSWLWVGLKMLVTFGITLPSFLLGLVVLYLCICLLT